VKYASIEEHRDQFSVVLVDGGNGAGAQTVVVISAYGQALWLGSSHTTVRSGPYTAIRQVKR